MLTRRAFVRRFIALAAAGHAASLLSACGQDEATPTQPAATTPAQPAAATPTQAAATTPAQGAETAPAAAAVTPERSELKLGLPAVSGMTWLLVWLIAERTGQEEGLSVQVIPFQGDGAVSQALVGGSTDLNLQSPNGLINMLAGGQQVVGFYSGYWQPLFWWITVPEIRKWEDVRGKIVGVTTPGSLTDTLTRYVLQKHGIDPGQANLINAGSSADQLQALKAGSLHMSCMVKPFCWQAQDEGLNVLGKQEEEVATSWPTHIYVTRRDFYEKNPNTIRAFLRAHIRALRLAQSQPDIAVETLARNMKLEEKYARMAYEDVMKGFNERGELPPDEVMNIFWDVTIRAGNATERWPNSRLLDRRYVDTFDEWAPS